MNIKQLNKKTWVNATIIPGGFVACTPVITGCGCGCCSSIGCGGCCSCIGLATCPPIICGTIF